MVRVLAVDVGGSRTRLAIFDGKNIVARETTFNSGNLTFSGILSRFLKEYPGKLHSAVIAVAGPVFGHRAQLTNFRWSFEAQALSKITKCPVRLVNDVEAAVHGLQHISPRDLVPISSAHPSQGTKAVLIPGTGLGEAIAAWNGKGHDIIPSEGGHADFAPRNALQWELRQFIVDSGFHASIESVLSGKGLLRIYDFLKHQQFAPQNASVHDAIRLTGPPAITAAAIRHDILSVGAVDLFVDILAAETQRIALTAKALGGVYLAGSIVPSVLPTRHKRFMQIFLDNRMRGLLSRVPVIAVYDEHLVLHGAH
jgi:glucokinase